MGVWGLSPGLQAAAFAILVVTVLGLGLGLRSVFHSGSASDVSSQDKLKCSGAEVTPSSGPLFPVPSNSTEERYRVAAVATDAEICSEVGKRILKQHGGSTIDAAIAAILCVGVYHAHNSGIGGGHFMTYYNRQTRSVFAVMAREQAPSGATEDMFTPDKNTSSQTGGLSIGIPGQIRGFYEAHKLGGRLPWKLLFRDAIKMCRDGFRVGKPLAEALQRSRQVVEATTNLRETFTNSATNQLFREGEVMTRPKLARTLEVIAEEGVDAFYNGSLTASIALDIQEANGIITEEDLRNYTAPIKPAITSHIHDEFSIHSPPPPSGGAIYQFIMNILDESGGHRFIQSLESSAVIMLGRFGCSRNSANDATGLKITFFGRILYGELSECQSVITGLDTDASKILNPLGYNWTPDSVSSVDKVLLTWHRIIEAFKHAFSLRTNLADPDVGSDTFREEIQQLVSNLTSTSFGDAKRSRIDDSRTFDTAYYEPTFLDLVTSDAPEVTSDSTSHLSVLGPNGDAVSLTSTINLRFGSKVIGSRTGIIFNDEMDDFATPNVTNFFGIPPSPANFIKPWKRPLSSMSPSIVTDLDGNVRLIVGAAGGTRIITSTALVTAATLWFNWGIKTAIDYPRIHHQLIPETADVEVPFPQLLIDGLGAKGHNFTVSTRVRSVMQGILRTTDGCITANSDYRKYGVPAGY